MTPWQQQLADSIATFDELSEHFELDPAVGEVCRQYPVRLTPYLAKLCKTSLAVAKQFLPDIAELRGEGRRDPLDEDSFRPVPSVIHRYPDRLLILASENCVANCRFCTRKSRVNHCRSASNRLAEAVEYVRSHPHIRHVILSGGDPLLLNDDTLLSLLDGLRQIDHVKILRVHSRIATVLPHRITREFAHELSRRQPIYIIFHFNHPDEFTSEAEQACRLLADAGIPLGNQSVLLKSINDDPRVMQNLVERLLENRLRPYYLHQSDGTLGTCHFEVAKKRGCEIIRHLQLNCAGLAVPRYVQDAPGNPFKQPLAD